MSGNSCYDGAKKFADSKVIKWECYVLIKVFLEVDSQSLQSCSKVSRQWKTIVEDVLLCKRSPMRMSSLLLDDVDTDDVMAIDSDRERMALGLHNGRVGHMKEPSSTVNALYRFLFGLLNSVGSNIRAQNVEMHHQTEGP